MYQVSCMLETGAVSQLVCLAVFLKLDIFLKQALKTNLSSSHSHKKFLLFLVNGRICMYMSGFKYQI